MAASAVEQRRSGWVVGSVVNLAGAVAVAMSGPPVVALALAGLGVVCVANAVRARA